MRTITARSAPIAMLSAVAVACQLGVRTAGAQEQEFNVSITGGATYSDNIGRAGENEESDTSANAGLRLGLAQERRRLTANIDADLQYRTYLDNFYEDELVGGLDGIVIYAFSPDRFTWTLEDNFGQTFIDRQAIETPDNRQNTNFFSTGPNVIFPLGGRTDLSIQARWSDVAYETSDVDNQRFSGTVGLIRRLAETSSVSLNGSAERVEYDQSPPASNYDSQSVYLGYQLTGARTSVSLQGGLTMLHDFGDTSDGPLASVSIIRQVSPRSTLSLDVGTNLTDSAAAFRRDRSLLDIAVGNEDAVVSADTFQSDYATVAWALERERSAVRLTANWRQEDHEQDEDLNREGIGGYLELSRRLSSSLTARFNGRYDTEDFEVTGNSFDDWSVGAGISWSASRSITISLAIDHYVGSGDTPTGTDDRDYEENRASLTFAYTPGQ